MKPREQRGPLSEPSTFGKLGFPNSERHRPTGELEGNLERRAKDTWAPLGSSQAASRVGPLASRLLLPVASSNSHKQSSCRPPQLSSPSAHGPPFFPSSFSGVLAAHPTCPPASTHPTRALLVLSVRRGASFASSPRPARGGSLCADSPSARLGNLYTMPVTRSKSVGNTSALTSTLGIVRLLEALFTCVAFSLVVNRGAWYGRNGDWCMFSWCFCFAITIVILVVEFAGLQHRMPVSWKNFPITFAMYATLMCLSASIIYPMLFIQHQNLSNDERGYRISATVFSCLACIAYLTEVSITRAKPGEVTGYMATVPGLLKVVETFIACIIFVFISDPPLYDHPEALKWCMAVYCICFILSLVVIILCIGEFTGWLPCPFNKFLSGYTLLAVLMYATATIIWPIYKFDRKHGGQPSRSSYCGGRNVCDWDKNLTIAVLTAVNLLVYLGDLVYSTRLIFIQG